MLALRLRFLDVVTHPGPRHPVPSVCRLLCSNVRSLAGNLCDWTLAWSRYNILLCSETLVKDMRHVSELLIPGFARPVLLCRGWMNRTRGIAAYVQDGYRAFRQPKLVVAKCWFLWFVVRDRTYMCSVFTAT